MNNTQTNAAAPHRIDIKDRSSASLTGVTKVENSNESELTVATSLGRLEIRGNGLKIDKFDVSDGTLCFSGNIDSFKYSGAKQPLIKRIFK